MINLLIFAVEVHEADLQHSWMNFMDHSEMAVNFMLECSFCTGWHFTQFLLLLQH